MHGAWGVGYLASVGTFRYLEHNHSPISAVLLMTSFISIQTAVIAGKLFVVGGGFMPYPSPLSAQPCWTSPLVYNEEKDSWEAFLGDFKRRVCASKICSMLRHQAAKSRVDMVAVEDNILVLVGGQTKMYHYTLRSSLSSMSCDDVWSHSCPSDGKKWKYKLKYPWHGHHSGKIFKVMV